MYSCQCNLPYSWQEQLDSFLCTSSFPIYAWKFQTFFFSNAFAVVFIVWIIGSLIKKLTRHRFQPLLVFLLLTFLAPGIYRSFENSWSTRIEYHSDQYLSEVQSYLKTIDKKIIHGAILFPQEETDYITQRRDKAFHIYPLAHYTNYSTKNVDVHNLSVFDAPALQDSSKEIRFKSLIGITPFFRFVEFQKMNNTFVSIEESQYNFISSFNLAFVVLRPNVTIPSYLSGKGDQR